MGPINLGPDWFWKLILALVIVGLGSGVYFTIYFTIKAIIWLIEHVRIV